MEKVVILILFLTVSCAPKENTKKELLKDAMDTGKELYLNTLLNEIRHDSGFDKHVVDSIYEFRRDTILNKIIE